MLALLLRIASEGWAWVLTVLFALGTAAWSTSSQALWQHTFGQAAIVACLYFLHRRWFLWCGVAIGIAIAIRPTNLLLVPAVAAALWIAARRRPRLGAHVCPRRRRRSRSPRRTTGASSATLAGGYPARLDGNFLEGLAGVLLSPGRGLLIYTPLALFALSGISPARQPRTSPAADRRALFCRAANRRDREMAGLVGRLLLGTAAAHRNHSRPDRDDCDRRAGAPLPRCTQRPRSRWPSTACFIQALGVYCYPKGHWDHLPGQRQPEPRRVSGTGATTPSRVPPPAARPGNLTRSLSRPSRKDCPPRRPS